MPTPMDRAMQSRNAFLGFAGIVTAVAAYSIWGGEMFPAEKDPTGEFFLNMTNEIRTINVDRVRIETMAEQSEKTCCGMKRSLLPSGKATREELVERVKANMRPPPRSS